MSRSNDNQDGFELSVYAVDDLDRSGLTPEDLAARPISNAELSATRTPSMGGFPPDGYVIPYFDLRGDPVSYYRVKFLDTSVKAKYKNPQGTENHIYFPPGLGTFLDHNNPNYLIITEGEKKAACALKMGFPCIALSGVDSWHNRLISFPEGTVLKQSKDGGAIHARLPSGDTHSMVYQESGNVANGLVDIIDHCISHNMQVIIIYDTDESGVKMEVQRAASQLGYELRYRGLPLRRIRQLVLPQSSKGAKVGLDDFLMHPDGGKTTLDRLLRVCMHKRTAFPRHPNPKSHINARLQKSYLTRKEVQEVSLAILMELEAKGRRLQNEATEDMFYFNEEDHTLVPVFLASTRIGLHETAFGGYLYREFNLGAADSRVVQWLASQFNGEDGVNRTATHKVLAKPDDMSDCVAFQLSDSHFVIVTPDAEQPFIVAENGTHGILFEQGHVIPIDHKTFEVKLHAKVDTKLKPYWLNTLKEFNFQQAAPQDNSRIIATSDELAKLATYLYYLSPWLLRWRGTQLPIELVIGEAGSGKSSLFQLRQTIITGKPRLSNITNDIKDWYAGITSSGGLYVMDNIHFTGGTKDYRQRLSDEFCRLITEPNPHVELRKLYTTNQVVSLPVSTTFAVTAIEQPFYNMDLIQRAAIFEVQSVGESHDSRWPERHLESRGGREGWLAHHLVVIHKFLELAVTRQEWDYTYKATHRLVNYEQALMLMSKVFGQPGDWIPNALKHQTDVKTSESDWTMEALGDFISQWKPKGEWFSTADIVHWSEEHDVYHKNGIVTNPWKLGKYIRSHRASIRSSIGIYEDGSRANKTMYNVHQEEK